MNGLEIRAVDPGGAALPARVSVRSMADGQPAWPIGDHPRYDVVQACGAERSFVCVGQATLDVAPGVYSILVSRGPESTEWRSSVTVAQERTTALVATLERPVDPTRRGWVSGDVHIHRSLDEAPRLLRAEDVMVGAVIGGHIDLVPGSGTRGSLEATDLADGAAPHGDGIIVEGTGIEVERIMGGPGAVIGLGMGARPRIEMHPWVPFDDGIADAIHAAGGHVDGEKVFWPSIPVLAALGKLDSVQLASNHFGSTWTLLDLGAAGGVAPADGIGSPRALVDWTLDRYYALLDCGFRVPASGGSGAGVMPNPVGASRVYARIDGRLDYRAWLAALRAGRTFSTNGPLIEIEVGGFGPGETVSGDAGIVPVRVWASSPRTLGEVSVIVDGEVAGEWHPGGGQAGPFEAQIDLDVSGAAWVAGRAFERQEDRAAIRFGHTSPVWVDGPGDPDRRQRGASSVLAWLDWTERLIAAAELGDGADHVDARRAVARARAIVTARSAATGSAA